MAGVLIGRGEGTQRQTDTGKRECHEKTHQEKHRVTIEAEIGLLCLQTKDCQQHQELGERQGTDCPRAFRENMALVQIPMFLCTYAPARSQYTCIPLTYSVPTHPTNAQLKHLSYQGNIFLSMTSH